MHREKIKEEKKMQAEQRKKYSVPLFWKWANPIFTSISVRFYDLGTINQNLDCHRSSLVSFHNNMRNFCALINGTPDGPTDDSH